MTADLAGPGAATAPTWLTSTFERDDVAGSSLPPSATCTFHGRTRSAAAARDFTARTLCGWGIPDLVPDAQIVVSELVTNALRHAPGDPADAPPIRLRLVKHRFHVGCGVSDASARVPAVSPWSDLSESGRGLHLVDALTAAWGWVLTRGGGKVVWALFDASPAS
ncbi:ATP-binding protein [Microbispora sp. NPDC004025]